MSSNATSHRRLRTAFRWIAVSLTFIVATWLVVILWWQITQRVVSTEDAILHLAALPLAVLLAAGLFRWRLAARRDRRHRLALPPILSPASRPQAANEKETRKTPILAAWAVTSVASEAEELIESLAERRGRPAPDEWLTNADGFPLLTARVPDLDTGAAEGLLLQTACAGAPEHATDPGELRDAFLRALALLDAVLLQAAQNWPLPEAGGDVSQHRHASALTLRGAAAASEADSPALELRATLFLSKELTPAETRLAQAYVAMRLQALGMVHDEPAVDIVTTDDDATALRLADEFADAPAGAPRALLLLATDSALCPTVTDRWLEQQRLFEPRRPNGIMAGEAAFGVLLADEKALDDATSIPICRLARVARGQHDGDKQASNAHACLAGAVGAALEAANVPGDAIGFVVCDADHRASQTLESIEAMLAHSPRLDAIRNRLAVNEVCGHLGAASALGVLAAGAVQAAAAARPVLIFNVSHVSDRVAAVLLPEQDDLATTQSPSLKAA